LFEESGHGIITFVSTIWTSEKIENYKSASEYTSFHKKLSVLAEPYLDERWTLADIGCGPGMIDYWLAPMVAGIDAIDSDPVVIGYLTARLDDVFVTNRNAADKIKPRLASVEELDGESWDVVMMSFFGVNKEMLETVLPLARRRVLVFMHGRPDTAGPLAALDDGNKFSASELEEYLKERKFHYRKNTIEMQFGQPFKTIESIQDFLKAYGMNVRSDEPFDDEAIKRMTDAEERIIKTNRFDYPYYLPKSISVALFIILVGHAAKE
jgi:SAM-dependent methyltransferase